MTRITQILSATALTSLLTVPAMADVTIGSGGNPDESLLTGITAAAWLRNDDPTRLAGPGTLFVGGASTGANDFRAYLSFDLSGLSGTATSATLSLWSQGATTFNANGGVNDLGDTPLNIVAMSDTITGWGEGGFQGAGANTAVVDGTGDPANYTNATPLFGAVLGTANFNIDTIANGTQMDISFNAAGLTYIENNLGGTLTIGLEAPDAVAAAQNSSARNFFALSGVVENGSAGDDTPPSLFIEGVVPEPGSLALLGLGGLMVIRRRRSN
jgi:hypothetical protein